MNTGFTETESVIIVLAEFFYCLAYTWSAWYFMKRNHRAEEIPQMIRLLTVLILFLTSILTLRQENALLYAGCGILILIGLSALFYLRSKAGIVETILFAMAIFGSYLVFTMLLDFFGYGFGSSVILIVGNSYFLLRSAVYLLLAAEYILVSRYFVKVFREKDQVFLTNGQTAVFLLIPFLMLALILALYLNGDTLLMIYGYGRSGGGGPVLQ